MGADLPVFPVGVERHAFLMYEGPVRARPWWIVSIAFVACKKPPVPSTDAAATPDAAPSFLAASAGAIVPAVDGGASLDAGARGVASCASVEIPPTKSYVSVTLEEARASSTCLVQAWSDALARHDLAALGSFYGERVVYYGKPTSRTAVLEAKRAALRPPSRFTQTIGPVQMQRVAIDGEIRVTTAFEKTSGTPPRLTTVEATIVFAGRPLRIVEETDRPSEDGASRAADARCEAAVLDVVRALPDVRKILGETEAALRKSTDRAMGGVGPFPRVGTTRLSGGFGVHQPERYEALVWYSLEDPDRLTVTVMGEDVKIPAAAQGRITAACK